MAIRGFWEKLLALFIGFLLWNYVVSQGNLEVSFKVPVDVKGLPSNVRVKGLPGAVEVRVRGAPWVVKGVSPGEIKVVVDLSGATSGDGMVYFDNVQVPKGVKVVYVRPPYARVRFVKVESKKVPVVVRWKRRPGFKWKTDPPLVKVVGVKRRLSRIKYLRTKPVDPGEVSKEGGLEVYLEVPKDVKVDPPKVRLEVEK